MLPLCKCEFSAWKRETGWNDDSGRFFFCFFPAHTSCLLLSPCSYFVSFAPLWLYFRCFPSLYIVANHCGKDHLVWCYSRLQSTGTGLQQFIQNKLFPCCNANTCVPYQPGTITVCIHLARQEAAENAKPHNLGGFFLPQEFCSPCFAYFALQSSCSA